MATVQLPGYCEGTLAASKDGRWIAMGSDADDRSVVVWDAKTFKSFFRHKENIQVRAVDFSPDSTRLVHASLASARQTYTATIWDVAARKKVLTLDHEGWVIAAKYSPQGDRIATATHEFVRVWDSNDGRLLMDIPVTVTQYYNARLLWSNNHIFFISDKKTLKQFEASTGLAVSEWPIDTTTFLLGSCIALPQHGAFIAYSIDDTVTFWDTSSSLRSPSTQSTMSCRDVGSFYHAANITTDISSRHTCIFSLETRAWSAATTSVQYNRSSMHEPKCETWTDLSW